MRLAQFLDRQHNGANWHKPRDLPSEGRGRRFESFRVRQISRFSKRFQVITRSLRARPALKPIGFRTGSGFGIDIAPQTARTDISKPPLKGKVTVRKRCAGSLTKAK